MLILHGIYNNGKVEIMDKNISIKNKTPVEITVIKEFIDSLPQKVHDKVFWSLRLFRELPVLKRPYSGNIENSDGICEAIIDYGYNTFRILFFFDNENVVILTHGFMKKTQKTPAA
jgi:phage-related protein